MIKAYSGIYAYSGIKAYLGITGLDGVGATDALLSASTFYIDPVKAHTIDGWLNFDKIDALTYHGTNPNGIGVSQATEANQAIMLVTPQYEEDGFTSSDEDDFALTGKGWLLEPEAENLVPTSANGSYGGGAPTSISYIEAPNGLVEANVPVPSQATQRYEEAISGGAYTTGDLLTYSWYRNRLTNEGSLIYTGDLAVQNIVNATQVGVTEEIESNVKGFDRFKAIFQITDGALPTTLRFYYGSAVGVGNSSVAYWGHQLNSGSVAGSLVYTFGSPITRAADNGYVNTDAAYVDRNPDFTGSAGNISLVGSKYEGLGTADWEGAVYYNTDGTESHCTAFVGASSLTWDGDINAGGLLTFTRSDFKDDPAAMLALRTAAGDTGPEQTKSVTMTVGNAAGSVYGYSTGNIVVAGAFGSMSDVNFVTGQALIVFGISSSGGNTVVTLAGDVDLTYVGDVVVNIAGYDVTLQHVTVGFVVGYQGTLTGTALFDAVAAEDGNDINIEYTYNAFAKIPTSEFRRRIEFIPQANSGDYSDDRKLTGSYTDADNYTELTVLANGNIRFDSDNATTNSTVTNTTTPLVAGQVTVIDLEIGAVGASNGSSMSVNADKDTFTLNAELYYNSTIAYCGGGDGVNKGFPIRVLRDTWYDSMGNIILDKTFDGLVS